MKLWLPLYKDFLPILCELRLLLWRMSLPAPPPPPFSSTCFPSTVSSPMLHYCSPLISLCHSKPFAHPVIELSCSSLSSLFFCGQLLCCFQLQSHCSCCSAGISFGQKNRTAQTWKKAFITCRNEKYLAVLLMKLLEYLLGHRRNHWDDSAPTHITPTQNDLIFQGAQHISVHLVTVAKKEQNPNGFLL